MKLFNTALNKIWPTPDSNPLFIKVKVKDYVFGRSPMLCNQKVSLENTDTKILCEAIKVVKPKTIVFDDGEKGVNTFSFFRYVSTTRRYMSVTETE